MAWNFLNFLVAVFCVGEVLLHRSAQFMQILNDLLQCAHGVVLGRVVLVIVHVLATHKVIYENDIGVAVPHAQRTIFYDESFLQGALPPENVLLVVVVPGKPVTVAHNVLRHTYPHWDQSRSAPAAYTGRCRPLTVPPLRQWRRGTPAAPPGKAGPPCRPSCERPCRCMTLLSRPRPARASAGHDTPSSWDQGAQTPPSAAPATTTTLPLPQPSRQLCQISNTAPRNPSTVDASTP
ncbi:hypothetical protein TraAM80_06888 [Trypanosoma rangeli]|uniref:Uncharacterized protein n=1 Tax=Trypanosoma rangeli TaxID=5698 RepID=A0A3R7RFC3_TRYRA|nr:uncharacterized protein TraAM80_06888 [Trypanosoma rangeli]RNF01588.1 hypothetical protein TraAM80_06888 [Trypanosoma rangeli]|eukprot:RNF01588.1 hypothetical protein TraAM80_06888 [Trypanosoma rangeli]